MVVDDGESLVVTGPDLVVGAMVAWYYGYSSGERESSRKLDAFRSFARDVLSGQSGVSQAARRHGFYAAKGKHLVRTFLQTVVPEMVQARGIDEDSMEALAWLVERHGDEIGLRAGAERAARGRAEHERGEDGARA
jgi:hypothetical protein